MQPQPFTGTVPRTNAPTFSDQEITCYQQFFAQLDTSGSGRIGGLQARDFLFSSNLDRQILREIWSIADASKGGELDPEGFSVALRLVAHAQTGQEVTPALVFQEAPAPPVFGGLPARSLGPVEAGGSVSRGRSPPPSGISGSGNRFLPNERDLRKYGRLFHKRVLAGGAALLPGGEAKDLFELSGLPTQVLQQIWFLADRDCDAHLSWPEFVLAMHLVRSAREGQSLPQPPTDLPAELEAFLGSLKSADHYARQPSRSPRSLSNATSVSFGSVTRSPSHGPPVEQPPGIPDQGFASIDEKPARRRKSSRHRNGSASAEEDPDSRPKHCGFAGFGNSDVGGGYNNVPKEPFQDFGGLVEDPTASGAQFPQAPKVALPDQFRTAEEAFGPSLGSAPSRSRRSQRRDNPAPDDWNADGSHSPDFGTRRSSGLAQFPSGSSRQPVEHLEVLIEVEKKLVQRLRNDVDELDEELQRLEEACREEESEASRERGETERATRERQALEQQLDASQRQLAELKVEHKGLQVEGVLLRRDGNHYSKEAAFLQKLLDEAIRDTQVLQQSVDYVERSNESLLAHTQALQDARREVLDQVQMEKELLKQQERETILAKSALETLKSGGGTVDVAARLAASRRTNEAMLDEDSVQTAPAKSSIPTWLGTSQHNMNAGGLLSGIPLRIAAPWEPAPPGPPGPAARPPAKVPLIMREREGV